MRGKLVLGIVVVALAAACNPSPQDSPQYQPGALGNGGFLFQCDDSVSCNPYNGDAAKFPHTVALGSTFTVKFVPKGDTFKTTDPSQGQTLGVVSETFMSITPTGSVSALKPGFGTILARDTGGRLVDFTSMEIRKPDSVAVFDAAKIESSGEVAAKLDSVSVKVGDQISLRAVARSHNQDLAGSLRYDWTTNDASIADIGGATDTKVTVVAKKAGTTTLTVEGGTFKQDISVEVTP